MLINDAFLNAHNGWDFKRENSTAGILEQLDFHYAGR